jgi:hypothetical protein
VNVVRVGLVSALLCDHDAGRTLLAAARSLVGPAAVARAKRADDDDDDDEDDDEEDQVKGDLSISAAAAAGTAPLARAACEFELTVLAFPTAVDRWSHDIRALAHHYVTLPAGDWVAARRKVTAFRLGL